MLHPVVERRLQVGSIGREDALVDIMAWHDGWEGGWLTENLKEKQCIRLEIKKNFFASVKNCKKYLKIILLNKMFVLTYKAKLL